MFMKIAGFIPTSFVDWHGKVVATVFTYGCNFRCPFCHNHQLVTGKVKDFILEETVIAEIESLSEWIDGVCITGGEPTLYPEIVEFAEKLSGVVPVKIDTNGTNPDIVRELAGVVDYIAMDVKAPREKYRELAGVNVDVTIIDESIHVIKNRAKDYEFRTTAVPILDEKDFASIAEWLRGAKRYIIQQYSTAGGTLDPRFSKLQPKSKMFLKKICKNIADMVGECRVVNL